MVRLRVVLRGVSPVIVRTLEVPGSATLDVLHQALLVSFDWSGECLHEFTIRAAGYSRFPIATPRAYEHTRAPAPTRYPKTASMGTRCTARRGYRTDRPAVECRSPTVIGDVSDSRLVALSIVDPTVPTLCRRRPDRMW